MYHHSLHSLERFGTVTCQCVPQLAATVPYGWEVHSHRSRWGRDADSGKRWQYYPQYQYRRWMRQQQASKEDMMRISDRAASHLILE